MAYSKQTWVRGEKVASAKLNHMEDGIATISANGAIDTANLADGAVTDAKLAQSGGVLSEVADLKSELDNMTETSTTSVPDTSNNLASGKTLTSGYWANSANELINNANFSYLLIDVSGIDKIYIDGTLGTYTSTQFNALGIFVNANDEYITSILALTGANPSFPISIDVPEGAATLKLNTDYKASNYPSSLPDGLVVYRYVARQSTKRVKFIAGVIRNSGNGWEYINDSGHEPLNLTSVSVDSSGRLKIDYGFTAKKVLSLVVCPDETFARLYSMGASVGLSDSLINVYRLPVVYGGLVTLADNTFSNVPSKSTFTSGLFNTTTGEIRLYHPSLADLSAFEKFNISAASANNNISVALGSQGNDYVSLYLYDSNGSVIKDTTSLSVNLYVARSVNAVFVNADNIVNANGNFWIFGVMEIED